MRKMATIRSIDDIRPIPDADAIECAVIGGWTVVVKKGEFKAGELAVYCEIDSWIPTEIAPFLSKGQEPREYEGVKGERLRTIRLRGQLSQGLLLPLKDVWKEWLPENIAKHVQAGDDVSESLNIKKYEPPIPASLGGQVRGAFPSSIPKTDQERIQNLVDKMAEWKDRRCRWEITEKLDGTSMTVFLERDGHFGVCGRNWELAETDDNSLWKAARANDLEAKMRSVGRALAIQGELIGEGIQGNPYKLKGQRFYVYDVYDIADTRYLSVQDRRVLITNMGVDQVPFVDICMLIDESVNDILALAEGKSKLCDTTEREGLVYKCMEDPMVSFKAISNKFLLREK